VLVLGGGFGWIAYRARVQREAVAGIDAAGGHVNYDWELQGGQPVGPAAKPPRLKWLIDAVGPDYVGNVLAVDAMDFKGEPDGSFMNHIGRLSRLETLLLSSPTLDDAALARLGVLSRLEHLDLVGGKSQTDAGLAQLRGLDRLEFLSIEADGVKGSGLAFLSGLRRLEGLYLRFVTPSDDDLAHLAGLTSLRYLVLSGERITDRGLAHLRGLTGLKMLVLNFGSSITVDGLSNLAGLQIETLVLMGSRIKSLEPLMALDCLKNLDVTFSPIDNAGLAPVAKFRKLEKLWLNGTRIDQAGLANIASLENLEWLILDGAVVTDASLDHLVDLPKLEVLHLSGGPAFTHAGLPKLARMPRLRAITIDGVWTASSGVVDAMPEALPGVSIKAR
jgi:hypothetical protein